MRGTRTRTNSELKALSALCAWNTNEGVTTEGDFIVRRYKSNGNWNIYLNGQYEGTVWYS